MKSFPETLNAMRDTTETGRIDFETALNAAVKAALTAGELMRRHFRAPKRINSATQYDIKLELDVRCQKRIERTLRAAFPAIAILGEEGVLGDPEAESRWVVDPIDGTVNFTYGIPHCCVSIALQVQSPGFRRSPMRPTRRWRALFTTRFATNCGPPFATAKRISTARSSRSAIANDWMRPSFRSALPKDRQP
jgi:hypothetical protein